MTWTDYVLFVFIGIAGMCLVIALLSLGLKIIIGSGKLAAPEEDTDKRSRELGLPRRRP